MAFFQDEHPVDTKTGCYSKLHQIDFLSCQSDQNMEQGGTLKGFWMPKGFFVSKKKNKSSIVEVQKMDKLTNVHIIVTFLFTKLDIGESHNVTCGIGREH